MIRSALINYLADLPEEITGTGNPGDTGSHSGCTGAPAGDSSYFAAAAGGSSSSLDSDTNCNHPSHWSSDQLIAITKTTWTF